MRPATRYAQSGDIGIAYQVIGTGHIDLVFAFPYISHLDLLWEDRRLVRFLRRLAGFARVILLDRRGVGLSDPAGGAPTLEERMDAVRAVRDASGSERAALLGMSEGPTMCLLFAATYPERTSALVLLGAMAKSTAAEGYPWAPPEEALLDAKRELISPLWGQGATVEIFTPSIADDPRVRELEARLEQTASPMRVDQQFRMFLETDVRQALPLIQAPTLVLHRRHDPVVNVRAARWLASQIAGSRYVELEGVDHMTWVGDNSDAILDEIEEFLTGVRPAPVPTRVLATVLVTDIVDSTLRAAELGDRRWRALLENHHSLVRQALERFDGREVKTTGDGFLATFDGPGRAIECASAIVREMPSLGTSASSVVRDAGPPCPARGVRLGPRRTPTRHDPEHGRARPHSAVRRRCRLAPAAPHARRPVRLLRGRARGAAGNRPARAAPARGSRLPARAGRPDRGATRRGAAPRPVEGACAILTESASG